jgi:hypothetical protein
VGALAERVRPTDLARDRRLPLLAAFDELVPGPGLRRGTTVAVEAAAGVTGATSLAFALAAGPSQAGSWVAAVGLGSLGLVAAAGMGVALERLVVVADPGRGRPGWAPLVAALVDGFDVVLVAAGGPGAGPGRRPDRTAGSAGSAGAAGAAGSAGSAGTAGSARSAGSEGVPGGPPRGRLRPSDVRRLAARVREQGSVLVAVGGELPGERSHLRLTVTAASWGGLGTGWGHLQGRRVVVEAGGRGESARPRRAELWLPNENGVVTEVEPLAVPIPLHRPAGDGGEGAGGR